MAKQNQDPTQKYYEYLKTKGVDVAPSYDSFVTTLQDDNSRKKYYDYLKTKDVDLPPTYESFSNTLIPKKKEPQSSEESTTTSSNQSFDPIENRKQVYNAKLEELIGSDEVINNRVQEINSEFQQRLDRGEFQSEEEANKAFQRTIKEDKTIKDKELEYVQFVDKEFQKDVDAIEKFEKAKEPQKEKASVAESALSSLNRNFYGLVPDLIDALGIGEKFINNYVTSPLGLEEEIETLEDTGMGKIASEIRSGIEDITPAADENTDSKITQVGGAIGQVLSYAVSGGAGNVGKVAKLEKALSTGKGATSAAKELLKQANNRTAQIASAQMSGYGYKRAIDEGASDGEAFASAFTSGVIGKTEALPIGKMFGRLNDVTGGVVSRTLVGGFTGGVEEFAQESLQTYLENLSAQQIYDSRTEITEGVLEAGEIGGYTGILMNGLVSAIGGKRAKTNNLDDKKKLEVAESETKAILEGLEARKSQAQNTLLEKVGEIEKVVEAEITQPKTQEESTARPESLEKVESQPQTIDKLGETTELDTMEGGKSVNVDGTTLITTETDNVITLESIKTQEGQTGQGKAKNALNKLTEQADQDGKTIELKVVPEEGTGTTTEGLTKLYEQAGFDKQGDKMVRKPKDLNVLPTDQENIANKIFQAENKQGDKPKFTAQEVKTYNANKEVIDSRVQSFKESAKQEPLPVNQEIESKTSAEIIKEGAKKGTNQVEVKFKQAFDKEKHSNLSPEIQESLKKGKIETFDITQEDISTLIDNPDVESIQWKLPEIIDPKVDVVQPEKSDPRQKSKTEERLRKELELGKEKRSNIINRLIADESVGSDLKGAVSDKKGNYKPTDKKLANKVSNQLIEDSKSEFGEKEGLVQVLELLKNNDIPPAMHGPIAYKLRVQFEALGLKDLAVDSIIESKILSSDSGTSLSSFSEDSSPEALIGLALRRGEENTKKEFKKTELYDKLEKLQQQYDRLAEQIKEGKVPSKAKTSQDLKKRGKEKIEEGKKKLDNYFKNQRGKLNAGVPIDSELLGALKDIFEGYMLETAGNVAQAFERTKKYVSTNFADKVDNAVLEQYREAVLEGNDKIIDQIVKDQQTELIKNVFQAVRRSNKSEGKVSKARINEMLDLMSDPDTNESAIMEIFAEQAGYDMLSSQDRQDIMKKTLEISKLQQEGKETLASKELENLQNYMLDIKADKYTASEIIYDIWYTFVLSGLTTVARSIKGSTITTVAFNTTRLVTTPIGGAIAVKHGLQALGRGVKLGYNTLKTGDTKIQIRDVGQSKPSYLKRLSNTSFKELGWDKPLQSTGRALVKILTAPPTYLFRSIVAADQILSHFSYEFNSTIIEYNNILNEGYSRKNEWNKIVNEVAKRRADDKRAEINQKAEAEYNDIKKNNPEIAKQLGDVYKVKRANEMVAELRDYEVVDKALRDAKVAALVSDPTGFLGNLYKVAQDRLEAKERNDLPMKALKGAVKLGLFPFMRVSFNWINMGMQYTPAGFYMASSLNKEVWTKQGIQPVSKLSKEEYAARASIGTAVFLGIANSIFDWDEEEGIKGLKEDSWIQVTGNLTGDYKKEAQTGKKPYSFRFKDPFTGEYTGWFKYIDNPLGFVLAPLGLISDEITFQDFKDKEKPGYENKQRHWAYLLSQGAFGVFRFSLDQSFNQSVQQANSLFSASDSDQLSKRIERLVSRPVAGLVAPRIYTQLYQYWKAYEERPEKETDKWYETALKNIPFADAVIKDDQYDIFGYPIVRNFEVPLIPDMVLQTIKENLDYREGLKEWELIQKYPEVVVSRFTAPDTYRGKKVDEEKKNEYVMEAGIAFREKINGNYASLNNMEPTELQEKLNRYRLIAMNRAKSKVYGN